MSVLTRVQFWADALERSVKTAAQTAVALLTANTETVGLLDVDATQVASVSGLAAVLSILSSIGSARIGDDSPSLVE